MRPHDVAGFKPHSTLVNAALLSLLSSRPSPILSPTSHSLFPLPLVSFPARPRSSSRRVLQSHARACRIVSLTNESVRALNTLNFNYPSPHFPLLRFRSTVPFPAQRRVHSSLLSAAATYFYSCRRLCKQSSTGHRASVPTAPRTGSFSASHILGADSSSRSLVIPAPQRLHADSVQCEPSLSQDAVSSRVLSTGFDLSVALHAFDAVQLPSNSTAAVSLPSSYDTTSGVLPIIADRVSLPDNLRHVSILSQLPDSTRVCYSTPSALLQSPEVAAERIAAAQLHKPRVLAERSEYVKLVHRMLRVGMLQLTSTPHCVNSLFGVPKGDDIRLILDARLANCYFVDAPHVSLPSPSHLAQLQATGSFAVAKCDLSNFYHQLVLPQWIRSYFALPSLTAREQASLASCSDLPPAVRSELASAKGSRLFPCCVTLPMGFSHSVFLAQSVHEHVLYSYSSLSPRDNLLNLVTPLIDRTVHGLYVDDCALVGMSVASVQKQYENVLKAYDKAQMPVKTSKCTPATTESVTVLGVDICGERGTISLSMERHSRIVRATAALLSQPVVFARDLARVLGAWTWQLLLRRPVLAALKHSYRFVNRFMGRPPRALWPCVARELSVLTALSPLLTVNLRAAWSGHLLATDASNYAAGVVSAPLRGDMLQSLWPLTSVHLPSLLHQRQTARSVPSHSGVSTLRQPSLDIISMPPSDSHVARQVRSAHWSTLVSSPWGRDAHINSLELEALYLGLRWCASRPALMGARLPVLLDSSVAYYIARKGRSSTGRLLTVFRRCSAITLATGTSLAPMWIPSKLNPADAPSRSIQALASGCHKLASAR